MQDIIQFRHTFVGFRDDSHRGNSYSHVNGSMKYITYNLNHFMRQKKFRR